MKISCLHWYDVKWNNFGWEPVLKSFSENSCVHSGQVIDPWYPEEQLGSNFLWAHHPQRKPGCIRCSVVQSKSRASRSQALESWSFVGRLRDAGKILLPIDPKYLKRAEPFNFLPLPVVSGGGLVWLCLLGNKSATTSWSSLSKQEVCILAPSGWYQPGLLL